MNKLIIHIGEGMLRGVYSTDPDIEIIVQDDDNIAAGDPAPVHREDMAALQEKSTINCRADIKQGRFFNVW